jgi:hypothetical protein
MTILDQLASVQGRHEAQAKRVKKVLKKFENGKNLKYGFKSQPPPSSTSRSDTWRLLHPPGSQ